MASANGYSIMMSPVRMGKGVCVFPDEQAMTEDEKQLICSIHSAVNGRYVSCTSRELLQERFDDNIFFVCMKSGAIIFSFIPENTSVFAEGAFIGRKDLKTAWKLCMPYLVYLFVSGSTTLNGTVDLDFFRFREQAMIIKNSMPADKREYAEAVIKRLRQNAAPFSFYSSRLPSSMILGNFDNITPENINVSPINLNSSIVFDSGAVMSAASLIRNRDPDLVNIRFCRTTPKKFRELRKAEIRDHCLKQYQRDMMKKIEDLDSSIKNVWFFSYKGEYYISIDEDVMRRLEENNGMIPFDELYKQMSMALETVASRIITYKNGAPKAVRVVTADSFEEAMNKFEQQNPVRASSSSGSMASVRPREHGAVSEQPAQTKVKQVDKTTPAEVPEEKRKGFFGLFRKDSK